MKQVLDSEAYVERLFSDRFGLALRKIPKEATQTADFEAVQLGARVFVAEIKNLEASQTSEHDVEATPSDLLRGTLSDDNGSGRVGTAIHKAAKQLRRYDNPRVLVLVNDDIALDAGDLRAAFTGEVGYVDVEGRRSVDHSAAPIANGRIRKAKHGIDLYVWIDRPRDEDGKANIRVVPSNEAGRKLKEVFFGGGD